MSDVCEICGWTAAIASMLAFGSFGAPIKSKVVKELDVDPLVLQSYKSFMCFATSWFVLLFGQEFTYSAWGIVSGLFWVPGGVATIFAIKNAGLAVGIGVGSSFIVLVSFFWGIFIFQEDVQSKGAACFAIFLMVIGICGMSIFSAPDMDSAQVNYALGNTHDTDEDSGTAALEVNQGEGGSISSGESEPTSTIEENPQEYLIMPGGFKFRRRTAGILAAVFNGTWGGSIMVPMKFAPGKTTGMGYLISFAVGASVVTLCLWIARILYSAYQRRSLTLALKSLPSFHLRRMWLPGCTCGTLWSIGNFFSLLSVKHLGEGVGYSVIQAAMLVSGLWGIFFYEEISDKWKIIKWLMAASLTISGILLLSYEHSAV